MAVVVVVVRKSFVPALWLPLSTSIQVSLNPPPPTDALLRFPFPRRSLICVLLGALRSQLQFLLAFGVSLSERQTALHCWIPLDSRLCALKVRGLSKVTKLIDAIHLSSRRTLSQTEHPRRIQKHFLSKTVRSFAHSKKR